MEAVAETDEALMNKYFEGEEFTAEEIHTGLKRGTVNRDIVPVLCGSAAKNKGTRLLLDAIMEFLPAPDVRPEGYPDGEAFTGENAFFDLQSIDALREYEKRMVIDWGKSARMWHQKGTTEKTIVAIDSADKHPFVGYEKIILTYDKLKEIVEDKINYELWQAALSNVKGVYLILDMANGKQYVGSAYGDRGILGRWECYVNSLHGNNKLMKEVICTYPERYKYFQFSILQIFSKSTVDSIVVHAENQWKEKLGTIDFGMNDN